MTPSARAAEALRRAVARWDARPKRGVYRPQRGLTRAIETLKPGEWVWLHATTRDSVKNLAMRVRKRALKRRERRRFKIRTRPGKVLVRRIA